MDKKEELLDDEIFEFLRVRKMLGLPALGPREFITEDFQVFRYEGKLLPFLDHYDSEINEKIAKLIWKDD